MIRLRRNDDAPPAPEVGGAPSCSGLSPGDDAVLARIADRIRRSGLGPAARLWFESSRPLSFLGAQTLHVVSPLAGVFWPDDRLDRLAGLLERRENYERFLHHLAREGEVDVT